MKTLPTEPVPENNFAPKVKRRIVGKQDDRTPEEEKIATIEKVYYDTGTGYQNLRETWKAAKVLDNSITENNVKKWKATLEAQKKQGGNDIREATRAGRK